MNLRQVLEYVQQNKRICPQPQKWQQLYSMLPEKNRNGSSWEPPLPLILAAWWDTPALQKMLRLREHIIWAEDHGCLDEIYSYLFGLSENEWFHFNE